MTCWCWSSICSSHHVNQVGCSILNINVNRKSWISLLAYIFLAMSSADLQRLSESRSPNCKYAEIVKKDTIAETDWLKLQTVTYRLGGKKDRYDREWNMASRTTTREDSDYADSVVEEKIFFLAKINFECNICDDILFFASKSLWNWFFWLGNFSIVFRRQ